MHVALAVVTSSRRVQGRLLHWHPESVQNKKALPASYPGLLARFAKETSLSKREMFPDLDHMDVMARQETITSIRGEPVLLQLPVVACYALTVHKSQSKTIEGHVRLCPGKEPGHVSRYWTLRHLLVGASRARSVKHLSIR